MTNKELQEILKTLPPDTEIYVRAGYDAWPARARVFKENNNELVLYFEHTAGDHRNYPEEYRGVVEVEIAPKKEG